MIHKTVTKIPIFWKFVPKFHKFDLKLLDKLKFTQNFLKMFSALFQFAFFFEFQQNFLKILSKNLKTL